MFEFLTPYAINLVMYVHTSIGPVGLSIAYLIWLCLMARAIKPITQGE